MAIVDILQSSEQTDPYVASNSKFPPLNEKGKIPCPPSTVQKFFNNGGGDLGEFLKSQGYSNKIKGCVFDHLYVSNILIEGVDFEDCIFKESLLKTAKISRVHFTSCTFIESCFTEGAIEEVQFKDCCLSSTDFYNSSLRKITFISSILPHSSFTDSQLEKAKFISSRLNGTSFLGTKVTQSAINNSDLTDTLFIDCEKEFVMSQCTKLLNRRPVIALGWNFADPMGMASLCEAIYKLKNVSVLRYPNSHPKIETHQLQIEVEEGCKKIPHNLLELSKAEALVRGIINGAEFEKIQERAKKITENCDGLNLPGGEDINEIFYKTADKNENNNNFDARRDLLEFCLLEEFEKSGKPAIGQCRGMQILNVKKGGTLKDLEEDRGMEDKELHILPSEHSHVKALKKQLDGKVYAYSEHEQAVDSLGKKLNILSWDDDIPKMIANEEGNFLFTQFHPEIYIEETIESYPQVRRGFSPESSKKKENEKFFTIFLDRVKEDMEKRRKPA